MTKALPVTEVIILAGGLGTRLRTIVADRPKPMADVAGRPFLAYTLDLLARQGIVRIVLSVGYQHEVLANYFGGRYNNMILDYVIERSPRGTGGALYDAFRAARENRTFVLNGDTFFDVDLAGMCRQHADRNADITMAVKPLRDFERYGTVELGTDGRITGFREKQPVAEGYINGGVYLMERTVADRFDGLSLPFSFEHDVLERQTDSLRAYAFVSNGYFIDIGIPEDYERAQRELPAHAR